MQLPALTAAAAALLLVAAVTSHAQTITKKSGPYEISLRYPLEGIAGGEEADLHLKIVDTRSIDPVQGPAPVLRAKITAALSMPAMPAMPKQTPRIHAEALPGEYGIVCFFAHGGDYQLSLTITPPDSKPLTLSFPLAAADNLSGRRRPKPLPYTLQVTTKPPKPKAGQPVSLTITILNSAGRQPVQSFEVVHEQLLHLLIVSKDLANFSHEHPEPATQGAFRQTYTFPTGGEYRLFADTAPKGFGSIVVSTTIKVEGPTGAPPNWTAAYPVTLEAGGITAQLITEDGKPAAGRTTTLTFRFRDKQTGLPPTDIQPWLGAAAHLILIHKDAETFVHSHPDDNASPAHTKGLPFLARLPKPGLYRGWLQFQRAGTVHTAAFTLEAAAGTK
jgi:hypothetical protein